ncbi:N-acetylglucosamine-6-phosphate deacetylase [Leifsonia sp. F6_8S_P_1B]|uniref:N-acetylglucosamine-6-phosphate deacetylase n=1 Tax=Leifsonia williamsii TaxID=3035919 RepID=A0ABT8KF95_9MICO|nr:N-acetylglucosamine-6-phosphate deacetylase [Leifsonia williamsii]MDN4616104.1 N-acetylglucosamine-6-phosphate deacetylase [Leifsonia williamsii]
MTAHVLHSARLVSEGRTTADAWVRFDGDRVTSVGTGDGWRAAAAGDGEVTVTDAGGGWLTPGFVDLHCHGGATASFDDGVEAIRAAADLHQRHGTTRTVVSLVTAPVAELAERVRGIAALSASDPRILGSHLEGPFLDVGHKGAHDPALLRSASSDDIELLLEAGAGTIRQITLAPELPGGMDAVRAFSTAGVAVAVGHTGATYEQTRAAFDAGASLLTHAFNGMDGVHHRAPGPVAAATHTPGVTLEIINDGVHVHPEVVRMAFAAAPGRVALITDAMAAAGAADGDYLLGALEVQVRDGVARLTHGGSIAGSTLTLDEALRRAVTEVGLPVEDAVRALTETPAAALGRSGDLGRLAAGYAADAVLLDDGFGVRQVWSAGLPVLP